MTHYRAFAARLRGLFAGDVRSIERQLAQGEISKNTYYDLLSEKIMRRVLRPDSVCVDVGCHAGSILRTMMSIAPQGEFFAFEPLPDLFAGLKASFDLPNVHLYEVALSDKEGSSSYNHVLTDPALSGLIRRGYFRDNEKDESIEVATRTLDGVLAAHGSPKVRFIKVDVEGGELLVFRGAIRTLRESRPWIAFEHGLGASDYYGYGAKEAHEILAGECGLEISLLAGWLKGKPALTRSEFIEDYENGRNFFYLAHPRR